MSTPASLPDLLGALEHAGLIRRAQGASSAEYAFRHVLSQEAAYQSLLKQDRRRLHHAVGRILERQGASQLDGAAPVLAHHFFESGDDARALRYLTIAADDAARRYANAEAIMYLDRAIEVSARSAEAASTRASLVLQRGRLMELCGDYAGALASYADLEKQSPDEPTRLSALLALATVHSAPTSQYDSARASSYLARAIDIARALGDRASEARALWLHLLRSKFNDEWAGARAFGEQSLAIARDLRLKELQAYILNDMFPVYASFGMVDDARAALAEAERLWRELNNNALLVDTLCNLCELDIYEGQFEQGISRARQALQMSRATGNVWGEAYSTLMIGNGREAQGHLQEALQCSDDGIGLSKQAGFVAGLIFPPVTKAYILADLGLPERGLPLAQQSLQVAEASLPGWRGLPCAGIIHCHVRMGDRPRAEAMLARAPKDAKSSDLAGMYLPRAVAELRGLQGDFPEMLAQATRARDAMRTLGMLALTPSADYLRAQALLALDREHEAAAVLDDAIALARRLGMHRDLWRMLGSLARCLTRLGNADAAQSAHRAAREEIAYILGHIDQSDLREAFSGQSEVRTLLENQ